MNLTELAKLADSAVCEVDNNGGGPEGRTTAISLLLLEIAVKHGCRKGEEYKDNKDESMYQMIYETWKVWGHLHTYVMKKYGIDDIDPVFPMNMFKEMFGNTEMEPDINKALLRVAEEEKTFVDKYKRGYDIVSVPEIENFSGDPTELMDAYFNMVEQLGTFYPDRDRYETDDQRKLHDKIVAIMQKLNNYNQSV